MQFTEIPADNRSPLTAAEIDPSQSGASSTEPKHALIIGHSAAGGSAAADSLNVIGSVNDVDGLFGAGSQLARMVKAFREVNEDALVSAIPVTGGGATAQATVDFTGPATADGAVEIVIDGVRYVVPVSDGDTATDIAAAVEAVLDADTQLSSIASSALGVLTLDAKWAGPSGNDLSVAVTASSLPAGVGATVTDFAGGTVAPTLDGAVAAMLAEESYDIVTGLSDTTSLATLVAEIQRRWLATVELDGHIFAAVKADVAAALTFGGSLNSEEDTVIATLNSPTPPHIWAAQVAAAEMAKSDPAAPPSGLPLPGVVAPDKSERADHGQRNQLLRSGISTFRVDASGDVVVDSLITTYQTTDAGDPDTTWLRLTTRRTVSYLRKSWTARLRKKFDGYKVAEDGTRFGPGQKVVTPATIKAEALAWFRDMEDLGLVENAAEFKARLVAVRDQPERIASLLTPDLVNELVTLATTMAFRK